MPISPNFQKEPLWELNDVSVSDSVFTPYNFTSLQYPENISTTGWHGHYINFYINVHQLTKFYYTGNYRGSPSQYFALNSPGVGGQTDPDSSSWGASIQKGFYQRFSQAISLYIPDSMQTNQTIQWDDSSLLQLGAAAAKGGNDSSRQGGLKDPKGQLNSASKNSTRTTSKVLEAVEIVGGVINTVGGVAGFAVNPQLLVIFRGLENRHFTYEFYFTPRNESEAKSVRNIIKAFRYHAHPDINYTLGAFFIAPSTFDIEFIHRGDRNKNIHMIKTCVLNNYSIDYAPNGWTTHKDGMPVQTKLTLYFKETDLITNKDVEDGY